MPRLGREKILLGGDGKTGKTYAYVMIAKHLIPAGSKMVVLQTDDGVTKVCEELGVKVTPVHGQTNALSTPGFYLSPVHREWMNAWGMIEALERWEKAKQLGEKDWVIWDGLDILRETTSLEYAERTAQLWDKPVDRKLAPSSWEAFINKRNSKRPILEGSDYQAIDGEISKAIDYLCYQATFNVIACTGVRPRREGQYADSEGARMTAAWYASMGMPVEFSGHAGYPRKFDTLILTGKSLAQGYTFQVFGDRGRSLGQGVTPPQEKHLDFYNDFLCRYAGWNAGWNATNQTPPIVPVAAANGNGSVVPPPPPPGIG